MVPSSKDLILLSNMLLKYMQISLWIGAHLKLDFSLCEDWFVACSTLKGSLGCDVYQYFSTGEP